MVGCVCVCLVMCARSAPQMEPKVAMVMVTKLVMVTLTERCEIDFIEILQETYIIMLLPERQ